MKDKMIELIEDGLTGDREMIDTEETADQIISLFLGSLPKLLGRRHRSKMSEIIPYDVDKYNEGYNQARADIRERWGR